MELIKPESALYPYVSNWMNLQFPHSDLIPGNIGKHQVFTSDTSVRPALEGGFWSRPDLTAILYSRPRFVPSWTASLYTFEVKTAAGMNETAIYEAVAHCRFSNYSVLVWQSEKSEAQHSEYIDLCEHFGIGAVTAEDPRRPQDYYVHTSPRRNEIDPFTIDQFIDHRFPSSTRMKIENWLNEMGWASMPREGRI